MRSLKSGPLATRIKAADTDTGTFEALVSVFGNVDLVGDRVMPGAFKGSLERWRASGDPIPVIWSHRWEDPEYHIGAVTDARETSEGLLVKGQLDMEHPTAAQVHRLLKDRRVREFSFAYDVLDERRGSDGANELTELEIHEVGPTLKGANPATQLVAAKASRRLTPTEVRKYLDSLDVPGKARILDAASGLVEADNLTPTSLGLLVDLAELDAL